MVKVWYQHDQNVAAKVDIDRGSDIDDLKQRIFGPTNKGQYQATYNGNIMRPSAKVPQNTTDDMPIVFTRIVNVPSPELDCGGDPCGNCGKCRDWHFTGDQVDWNWVCNYNNWTQADMYRWRTSGYNNLFTSRGGATCDPRHPFRPGDRDRLNNLFLPPGDSLDNYLYVLFLIHVCLCEKH
ncbi:unnamed protein product [Adineta steineri]|uniref:Uncharacterized protein n=1 Tax=Adineta steineri TaxID=433720 RepID=A0A819L6F2_9BILA|nr:unnamed protein product [Adineta steineri]CAF3959784.1 unnamed protein product [Adineta steineri]